ncbi:MAG: hypothetical protein FWD72_02460 [Eggerthellaceae bacterium]|nr:hypothetical protein [Eggerthellaceae bacterium]
MKDKNGAGFTARQNVSRIQKRALTAGLAAALLFVIAVLAACTNSTGGSDSNVLSGSYTREGSAAASTVTTTYTFSGTDQVEIEYDAFFMDPPETQTATGTYTITNGTISFTWTDVPAGPFVVADQDRTFEQKGDSILLDGLEYKKAS